MQSNTKRGANVSCIQKDMLIEFIESHPEMKSGKFSQNFTVHTARKKWEQLAVSLNAVPGAKKPWHLWRKVSRNKHYVQINVNVNVCIFRHIMI